MKEDDLYQTTRGNMVFSEYMRRCYKHDIALQAKKQRCLCPEKNTPRFEISGITEKDDIHAGKYVISSEIPYLLTP